MTNVILEQPRLHQVVCEKKKKNSLAGKKFNLIKARCNKKINKPAVQAAEGILVKRVICVGPGYKRCRIIVFLSVADL